MRKTEKNERKLGKRLKGIGLPAPACADRQAGNVVWRLYVLITSRAYGTFEKFIMAGENIPVYPTSVGFVSNKCRIRQKTGILANGNMEKTIDYTKRLSLFARIFSCLSLLCVLWAYFLTIALLGFLTPAYKGSAVEFSIFSCLLFS